MTNKNVFIRMLLCLVFFMAVKQLVSAQNAVTNYSFTTDTYGYLTDMSSSSILLNPNTDDTPAPLTNIGFDFYFMGARYSQFSVNDNGSMRLGAVNSSSNYHPLGISTSATIAPFGADQRVHAVDGKVAYKLVGTAPDRVLIVQWLNMQSTFQGAGTADLTYEVRLYETSGIIEFVYGSMTMGATGASDANSNSPQIGFSSGTIIGTSGSVTAPQDGLTEPSFVIPASSNSYTAGPITVLSSSAEGTRRVFHFLPTIPSDPIGPLTFTSVAALGMTLNWTDTNNENGYAIYRSDDDGVTYNYINAVTQNSTSAAQTVPSPSKTYYWKVYAISEGGMSNALSGAQASNPAGKIMSNGTGGGLWSASSTWQGGIIPSAADSVIIKNADIVTVGADATAYELIVGGGNSGILQFEQTTARTLTVTTNVTILPGGVFQSNAAGTQTAHNLSLSGNLTNNGTLDFSISNAGAIITFTGSTNSLFSGSGSTTDIRVLSLNKTGGAILELKPDNLTVRGVNTDIGGFLTMTNGTLKISGTFTMTSRIFTAASYTVPAGVGIWLNNPNFTIAAQNGNAVFNGTLRLTNGTWNIGTLATSSLAGTTGTFIIEGGTLNLAGRLSPAGAVTYTQSGGSVNVATVGNTVSSSGSFQLATASTFNMSGGAINLVKASTGSTPIDWSVSSTNFNYTGGILQAGTGATGASSTFRIRSKIPKLVVDNTTFSKTAQFTASVTSYGDVVINSGSTLNFNSMPWFIQGTTITNNGTLIGSASGSRFYFQGTGAQTYKGSGTVSGAIKTFEIDNAAGLTIDPASNNIPVERINFYAGGLTNSNKITIGSGGASIGVIQIGVSGVTRPITGFDAAPVFNVGTGGLSLFYAPELGARTTGFEIPASRTAASLAILNTYPITLAGGDLTITGVGGTLGLGDARFITGNNTLYLSTGAVTRSNGYVEGNFSKSVSPGVNVFEVGTANGYSPVYVDATGGSLGLVTVSAVQSTLAGLNPVNALKRYWTVAAPGLISNLTFNYLPGDVYGNQSNYMLLGISGGVLTAYPGATIDTVAHTVNIIGVSGTNNWTLAEVCSGAVGGTASGSVDFCVSGTPAITAAGYSVNNGITYQWQSSDDNFVNNAADIAGQTNPASLSTGVVTVTTSYRLKVTCVAGGAVDYSNAVLVTINTLPASYNVTLTGSHVGLDGSETGVNYQLFKGNAASGSPLAGTGSALDFGAQSTGTYTVVATNATSGCSANMSGTAELDLIAPTITLEPVADVCEGATTISLPYSATTNSPVTYSLYFGKGGSNFTPVSDVALTSSPISISIPANTQADTYGGYLTVSNGLTSEEYSFTFTVNPQPNASISGSGTICSGATNLLSVGQSGKNGYAWGTSSGSIVGSTTGSELTINGPGTYNVTVTNGNCVVQASKTVTSSPGNLPNLSITPSGSTTFCKGNYISLKASGGTSSYLWNTGITTNSIQVTTSGTYSVTVTNGCGAVTASQDVTVNNVPVAGITADNTQVCPGAEVTLTGSGGASYNWSGGVASGSTSVINAPGTYTVIATDINGCTAKATKVIAAGSLPAAVITASGPTAFCKGGSVILRGPSGATYLWSNGSTASFITVSASNNYLVTITNACGSTTTSQSVTVNNTPVISIASSATQVCQGAEVTLTASGASAYAWSGGTASGNQTVINTAGSYSVTATDGNGCTAMSTKALPAGLLPKATISPSGATTFCKGSYITLKAAGGANYTWSTGSTASSIQVTTGGVYTVTATNSCGSNSESQNITVNPLPVANITANNTQVCPGSEVTLTGSGGVSYAWSAGVVSGNQTVINSAGTYTVTATDGNGCSAKASKTLTAGSLPVASITASGPTTICKGASVTLRGPSGASYLWSNNTTASFITVSNSGNYSVTITNACGVTTASQGVTVNTLPVVSITADGPTAFNSGGSVHLTAAATGNGGYGYNWSTAEQTQTITAVANNNYIVTVTDVNGCTGKASKAVTVYNSTRLAMTIVTPDVVAYPNPFSSELSLHYGLQKDQKVSIELMDLSGKTLAVPVKDEEMSAGNHEYRLNANDQHLSTGLYLLRFTSEERNEVIKISYIK